MVSPYKTATNGEDTAHLWVQPSNISYLHDSTTGELAHPKFIAEWTLRDDYTLRPGLLIGDKGKHFKMLQKTANERYGECAVLAIWATKTPYGKTVFAVLGNHQGAILETLTRIKEQSAILMANHGWTIFPTPMSLVFYAHYENPEHLFHWVQTPHLHQGWTATKYNIEKWCYPQCGIGAPSLPQ